MSDFIGRAEDLRLIDEAYNSKRFRSCAIIGRRRIGKSTLIQKFIEDKKYIYFEFLKNKNEPQVNLRHMERVMSEFKGTDVEYRDFIDAFADLSAVARSDRYVIVFDEYPRALTYDSFSSLTANLVDREIGDSFLIVCGSEVKMMESEIEDVNKPLYRRPRRIDIKGLSLQESREFHPNMSDVDALRLYILTGGSPFYLDDTPADTFREYMERYVLPVRSLFHDEGETMIYRELPNPDKCISILDALSAGRNEVKLISDYTKMDNVSCGKYLQSMMDVGIITTVKPMAGAPKKPILYRISDGMALIYFRILRGRPNAKYAPLERLILTEMGRLFELFCEDFISESYDVLKIGSWFGKIPRDDYSPNGRQEMETVDIDVVAEIYDGNNTMEMFAECKFRKEPMGFGDLNELERRIGYVHAKGNYRKALISPTGFTKDLEESGDAILIDGDVLFGRKKVPEL